MNAAKLLGAVLFGVGALATASAQTNTLGQIALGPVVLQTSTSETAQVFHIVDQVSQWSSSVHRAYVRWATRIVTLDENDKKLLDVHAEMRRKRGWGEGFEPAFLVDASISEAAASAVTKGLLTQAEADAEREVLTHFAVKFASLRREKLPQMEAFLARVAADKDALGRMFTTINTFSEASGGLTVPVFVLANPEEGSGGGRATGRIVVVEVPAPDPMGGLVHEVTHFLLAPKAEAIRKAAEDLGVTWVVLNEGITRAVHAALTDDRGPFSISDQLVRLLQRGSPATDPQAQEYMMAAVLRPMVRDSLDRGETFGAFLPKAIARWRAVTGAK